MDSLKIFSKTAVLSFVKQRVGEHKLGEKVTTISSLAELSTNESKFVLVGIPEDIGVRANYGIGGAKTAWENTLSFLLNIQSNSFLTGEEILVLGHFEIAEPTDETIVGLRNKTAAIDALVAPVIEKIFLAGKIPIVVGGGHNNAFPLIKALHAAKGKQQINVVNIDAHTDLRHPAEGRHSGNGFSAALEQGFLNEYRVFGLHQNYVHQSLATYLVHHPEISVKYFEDILIDSKPVGQIWKEFIAQLSEPCGLEIDLDSIENSLSSATSPSGFALNDIRRILLTSETNFSYLHLCEGAVKLTDGREDLTTGKAIAYLITDFIRVLHPRIFPQPSS